VWRIFGFFGFDPRKCIRNILGFPAFVRDVARYGKSAPPERFRVHAIDLFPVCDERGEGAGIAGGHYFHQDLWAARRIFRVNPPRHIDIGSRMDGFVAHVLSFMPVTVIDIRALESSIPGLTFICDDATALRNFEDNSVSSLSSLHAAEHFGLGRYSDPIDPQACFQFMASLQRVLSPEGRLYFSVPIGRERVDFNAHRVFAPETILSTFKDLSLVSFSYVDDAGHLHEDQSPLRLPELEYGCGLFEFTKA